MGKIVEMIIDEGFFLSFLTGALFAESAEKHNQ